MSLHKRRLAAMTLGLLAALALLGWYFRPAPPRYTVTDLGVLPGAAVSGASGINNRGDVVGLSGPERIGLRHAFLYRNGVMTDLGRFGLIGSHIGPAISDSGSVAGVLQFGAQISGPGQRLHAFLYDAGGMHDLGTPLGASMSMGEGINRHGQIVGEAWGSGATAGGNRHRAFLIGGGRTSDIGILPGCTGVYPTGINAAGQVVGYCDGQTGFDMHPFLYDGRTRKMTALATPPGALGSMALGINDQGQEVGLAFLPQGKTRAIVWTAGRVTDLGTLHGLSSTEGAALNNRGEVVGTAYSRPGRLSQFVSDHLTDTNLKPLLPLFQWGETMHLFVYRAGRMADLSALIPARSGWVLQRVEGINDKGQIVGEGLHDGRRRAFLLTPR